MTEPVVPTPAEPREPDVTIRFADGLDDVFATELIERFQEAMRQPNRMTVLPPTQDERERAAYERGKAEAQVHAEVIVPCRDTREDLDGALCTGEFRYGPHDIQAKCTVCGGWRGRYAPAELTAFERGRAEGQAATRAYEEGIFDAGVAAGLRQVTEGQRREWGAEWAMDHDEDYGVYPADDEDDARSYVRHYPGHRVVSRLVGPWEPAAEQPEPDLYADEKPEGSDR